MNQVSTPADSHKQRRPGGRTADVTRRINEALIELLAEGGLEACTFQSIAARAGIDRSTLYRRQQGLWPLIVDAIIQMAERETSPCDTGSFREDLSSTLVNLAKVLDGPVGPSLMEVAGALQLGVAPGEAERFWQSRQQQLAPMFDGAIERGELPADVDQSELFAMAAGPIYFRKFVSAQPLTEEWVRKVVNQVCDRYCKLR